MTVGLIVNQSYFLGSTQIVSVTDFNDPAINCAGGNSLNIQGGVYGLSYGIYDQGKGEGANNTSIFIGDTGDVTASYYGIALVGDGNVVLNRGEIYAAYAAIGTFGSGTFDVLRNYGDIISGGGEMDEVSASIHTYSNTAKPQLLVNSGLIVNQAADGYAVALDGSSVDTFRNNGEVVGDIRFGNGDDIYNGQKGVLEGEIYGDGGNDKIIAGADDDQIHGGYGLDRLTGGLGEDTFYFDGSVSGAGNADVIMDFDPDNDVLALDHSIFGIAAGKFTAASFLASKNGAAADTGDHFLYNTRTGNLYYDADGKGGNNAELMATFLHHPDITASDFIVI